MNTKSFRQALLESLNPSYSLEMSFGDVSDEYDDGDVTTFEIDCSANLSNGQDEYTCFFSCFVEKEMNKVKRIYFSLDKDNFMEKDWEGYDDYLETEEWDEIFKSFGGKVAFEKLLTDSLNSLKRKVRKYNDVYNI